MGKSLILGTLFGAIILFVWMTISWTVIPWHCKTFGQFTHEESVASVIKSNTTESGIYVLPNCHDKQHQEKSHEMTKNEPIIFMSIRQDGHDFESPKPYIIYFLINLVGACLVTLMTLKAKILSYKGRLGFITLFGIAAGVIGVFPNWNWWGFSTSYTLVSFLDYVIGWFLAGLAIAAITRPKITAS